jgi:NAD(P)-dependent dehydrogenase (short-subunit alcohol dehydrogenase family)
VNIRLIAATNRNLEKMIAAHEFRSDLFYRLNVFPIGIPPLRERKDDIPLLVSYFVEKFAKQMQKKIDSIPASVMKALKMWEWPGNIRELENLIERAVILTRDRSLEAPLSELRKLTVDEAKHAPADQDNIARIVKETIKALHANSNAADQDTKKQRDAIVRAVFANAGISQQAPLGTVDERFFDLHFDANVKGLFFTVQKALPLLKDGASIILNASIATIKGFPGISVYSATKAAVRSFARTWTNELRERRIRVNATSPGHIDTPIFESWQQGEALIEMKQELTKNVPLCRLGDPDEIAKAVAFLASDEASYISGIELFVDGGVAQI